MYINALEKILAISTKIDVDRATNVANIEAALTIDPELKHLSLDLNEGFKEAWTIAAQTTRTKKPQLAANLRPLARKKDEKAVHGLPRAPGDGMDYQRCYGTMKPLQMPSTVNSQLITVATLTGPPYRATLNPGRPQSSGFFHYTRD